MTRIGWLGVTLVLLTGAALAIGVSLWRVGGDPLSTWAFRTPIVLSVPVYFGAVFCVLRGARPRLATILGVAALLRLLLLAGPPMLSSDVFRYVWDGRVQDAGINPYLYVPVDPALAALRDPAVYPHINRATYAPTIYPPAAQVLFAAVAAISPSVLAMKAAMVAMEALAVGCLLRILRQAGRPAANILIYAWNPLGAWEFAGNGHVDAAAIGLLALALVLRCSRRDGIAGAIVAAAVLVKFLPAIVAPALFRRGRPGLAMLAGGIAVTAALYGFYILFGHAGAKVLGFLGAYGGEEGLDTGNGIWALAGLGLLGPLPAWAAEAYLALAGIGLAAIGLWIGFRPRPRAGSAEDAIRVCSDAALLAACLMVVISPHYAWYLVWLAVPAVVAPYPSVIWLSAASLLLYYNPLPDHFVFQSVLFAPALLLAWRDILLARAAPGPVLQGGF